ncbi:hypothetical protein NB688_002543 [Xanthomonas sacchari]|uniref:Lipoprotein n=1 Tax=Xanthomonas sacchari TaxID=56458 RepID=A0ABT3DUT5_9XANT|nr:hypothetical protein [Xanthomonas sacchari]MCW0399141.1 hypothetical protein [Xanthomonas sacchari]MCW0420377.1 hypothetical protein [Xanthomonas sacchari]UYK74641.1 hypothetical protein NG828_10145 [Xanthomonas sacchari]
MSRIPLLPALCLLGAALSGCGMPQLPSVDALAGDADLLDTLRTRCMHGSPPGRPSDELCERVERADLQRLLSGRSDAGEYRELAEIPPLPATFEPPTWPCHE